MLLAIDVMTSAIESTEWGSSVLVVVKPNNFGNVKTQSVESVAPKWRKSRADF